MSYRDDSDLDFLQDVSSDDLDHLVYVLTHSIKDSGARWTEGLTRTDKYKKHCPDHQKYWELIAHEIQLFGANTLVTVLRGGRGVTYKEILTDVCDKLKVNYNKKAETITIEQALLAKALEKSWGSMSDLERERFLRGIHSSLGETARQVTTLAGVQGLLGIGGIAGYTIANTAVVSSMASVVAVGGWGGLSLLGWAVLPRMLALPIALATSPLLAWQLAGEAYRVTVPVCILIATLRKKYEMPTDEIIKINKQSVALRRMNEVWQSVHASDKKMLGLYLVAKMVVQGCGLDLSDDDIRDMIFSLDKGVQDRLKSILPENTIHIDSIESAITFAVKECGCTADEVWAVVNGIVNYSIDESEISQNVLLVTEQALLATSCNQHEETVRDA